MKVYCRSGSIVNSLGSDIDQHWNGVLDQSTTLQPKQLFNGFDTFASYLSEDQWRQLQIDHSKSMTNTYPRGLRFKFAINLQGSVE